MIKHRLGSSVTIEVHGGARSIGGNCVVVRDEKSGFAVMLDQGLNFGAYTRYYGGYIEPHSLRDLYEVKAIPPPEAYEGVDAVFISHLHLDHLGALSMAEEQGVELYVPHVGILAELTESWEWSWRSILLPSTGSAVDYARSVKAWRGVVKPIRVNHSAYPSYAFLVETSEGVVLYTGDFRLDSPLRLLGEGAGTDTLESMASALSEHGGVDVLVIEGTNLGVTRDFVDSDTAVAVLRKLLENYKKRVVFATYHPLDVESFALVAHVLAEHGFTPVLLHERYAGVLDTALSELGVSFNLYFYDVHSSAKRHGFRRIEYLGSTRSTKLEEAVENSRVAVFLSYRAVDELRTLANQGMSLHGALLVQLTSEPHSEEYRLMEARTGAWLSKLGVHSYRVRISGHYYPHQLSRILEALKPREIIPVHTLHPEMLKPTPGGQLSQ